MEKFAPMIIDPYCELILYLNENNVNNENSEKKTIIGEINVETREIIKQRGFIDRVGMKKRPKYQYGPKNEYNEYLEDIKYILEKSTIDKNSINELEEEKVVITKKFKKQIKLAIGLIAHAIRCDWSPGEHLPKRRAACGGPVARAVYRVVATQANTRKHRWHRRYILCYLYCIA
jgi:hypothetical protein